MADSILKVRITPEMVQDLVAFHGMNVITELKKIAKEQMELNGDKGYEFVAGTNILGEWQTSKTFNAQEIDELENTINFFRGSPIKLREVIGTLFSSRMTLPSLPES